MSEITVVITANGEGRRMKGISPLPKHLLWYGGSRIIDCIRDSVAGIGPVKVLTRHDTPGHDVICCPETATRAQTLSQIADMKNVLLVDCDVIPIGALEYFNGTKAPLFNYLFYFESEDQKYGGIWIADVAVVRAEERASGTPTRASGVYFLKSVREIIKKMTDPDSVASGMIGALPVFENSFIRLGDPEDYLNALK